MLSWIKPITIENSKIPVWLSYISPIDVHAISLGPFVFCREKLSESVRIHESIHFWQQLELAFVIQWILYAIFYVVGRITQGSWKMAYYCNPFEVEAYENQDDKDYLKNRKPWSWIKHMGELKR